MGFQVTKTCIHLHRKDFCTTGTWATRSRVSRLALNVAIIFEVKINNFVSNRLWLHLLGTSLCPDNGMGLLFSLRKAFTGAGGTQVEHQNILYLQLGLEEGLFSFILPFLWNLLLVFIFVKGFNSFPGRRRI